MKVINIPCDSEIKVQSSLDFYLGITSLGNINSLKELRKSMYEKFTSEYKEMNYPLVDLSKAHCVEEVSEEEVSEGHTSASNFLQMLQHMRETPTSDEEDKEDIEEDYEEGEDVEYEEEEQEEYIESEEDEEEFIESEDIEEVQENIDDNKEYISHGIYIEDLIDGTISIPTIDYGNEDDTIEEYVEEDEGNESIEWEEDNEDEEEDLSSDEIFLPEEEEVEEEEWDLEDDEDNLESQEEQEWTSEIEEDNQELGENWFSEDSENEVEIPEVTESVQEIKKEVSIEDDGPGADIPSDIRVFLKQHPNSDMSYVLKFYPKKEVDKQLKLGRIYKRKGKLMI